MHKIISRLLTTGGLYVAICFSPAIASESDIETIYNALKDQIGDIEKDQIEPSQVDGLYKVTLGFEIYYISSNGKYLINGDVIELATGNSVDGSGLDAKRQRMISTIPDEDMVVYSATTDKKTSVTIFTDTTCPYCRKLHEQIPLVLEAGIDVRYLAYPRAGVTSQAAVDMASIWCADDKQAAMTASKLGRPVKPATCDDPIAKQYELGVAMQIRGTPAIILENGEIIAGYVPAERLITQALAAATQKESIQ